MIFLLSVFLFLGLGQSSLGQIPTIPTEIVLNETEFVDSVLDRMRESIHQLGLDVVHLPSVNFRVNNYSVALSNGTLKGLGNIERVGDVLVRIDPTFTTIRSAFGVSNITADEDVEIHTRRYNYSHGHVHVLVDNVTVFTVYRVNYLTQTVTLDEFALSVGYVNVSITGLGERLNNDSILITQITNNVKGPLLQVFNLIFRILINAALAALRAALFAG